MHCPKCKCDRSKKNGFRRGKQSYRCKNCGCQYVENPKPKGYSPEVKQRERMRVQVVIAHSPLEKK